MILRLKAIVAVLTLMLVYNIVGCENQYDYSTNNNETFNEIQNSDINSMSNIKDSTKVCLNNEVNINNEEIKSIKLQLVWEAEVRISQDTKPVISEEDIFVGSKGFTCLYKETGKLRWSQEKAYLGFVENPYYDKDMISYVDLGVIYVLKRSNGKILFQHNIMKEVNCTTAMANGILYYLERGLLNALDIESEKVLWYYVPENSVPASYNSNMILYDNTIIYETMGRIISVDLNTRETKWDTGKIGADDAPIVLWNNNAYVLTHDGKLYTINADDGEIIWEIELQYDEEMYCSLVRSNHLSYSSIQLKDENLFFSASNGHIYGVNLLNGEISLDFLFTGKEKYVQTNIATHDSKLFFINNNSIYSINFSGEDLTVYNTGIPVGKILVIQDGEFYFTDVESKLYKFK